MVRSYLGVKPFFSASIKKAPELSVSDLRIDKVILTGSSAYIRENKDWMTHERKYIEAWMKKGIPILGICFGAQLLAHHIFGAKTITALPYPINGSILMEQTQESVLFNKLPKRYGVIATHYEGFTVPEKNRISRIEDWPCYAFNYEKTVFGVQFHPELSGPTGHCLVKLQRFMYDRTVYQDFSVHTKQTHGKQIFMNFLKCH
jgi:GMP synthase-like glutamine amidotransferase